MHRVVVLALEGVYPFELSIPVRIFGTARDGDGDPLYEVVTCGLDGGPIRTSADFAVAVEHGAEALGTADTLVIPPFVCGPTEDRTWLPDELAEALGRLRPGTRIVSICTASYVLAAAGLLDGRTATTHWNEADRFQRMFPQVRVDPDVLFVDDGDVLTAAGVAAGVDLCMHLVRRDHGSEVANRVARLCVVPPWRDGGQAQFIERPVPESSAATTSATRDWALGQLHRPLALAELAEHARMSVRTFSRRFRDEVGMTPGQWLTQQRVEHARRLLESTDLPVDRIAGEAGFGTAASLRQHLTVAIGVSPMTYRHTFRTSRDTSTSVPH
ncbi:Transcriptional regulator GlxA family, contains an amidase domain and an AraC-type DNA-binding HTH domain [Micromonospora pallida]|uniref:Transcriptional regulator GlxA family, contains an amidase domain and an AraC-type DNA-binding HTH domain n=1 Tax=Micromonospora pallida TaxID=145854 RepID=A0A1C6SBV5_9ACTN|nr:helix-turn-helix domain-containing protein [Micromonospora pallida]SCL26919.1 Transcriptional regulator GlxA family, contains an amidase domain and an AraC-type DNA-binding HTH domain [Micromonospora pallida]